MEIYLFGAGASVSAGYPLASRLLIALAEWLRQRDAEEFSTSKAFNRLNQIRHLCGTLEDCESVLQCLASYGSSRIEVDCFTLAHTDDIDECMLAVEILENGLEADEGKGNAYLYPSKLRSDLVIAVQDFFCDIEKRRDRLTAYDYFAASRARDGARVITFNYDFALERALRRTGHWDVRTGYGFALPGPSQPSPMVVYKLHGSVNWFKRPMDDQPPPIFLTPHLDLLGYSGLADPRVGAEGLASDPTAALILPDPQKDFYWTSLWEPLWESAAADLRGASTLYVHGYSFPVADERARDLVFGNVPRKCSVRIYCLGDSDRIAEEFHQQGYRDVESIPSVPFERWAAQADA